MALYILITAFFARADEQLALKEAFE